MAIVPQSDSRAPLVADIIATLSAAAKMSRALQQGVERLRVALKDDRSPVTVADLAVQGLVAARLASSEVPIVGEERADLLRRAEASALTDAVVDAVSGPGGVPIARAELLEAIDSACHDGSAERYWTLDPIDGTKGFLRGQHYAIALALIEGGEVTLGALCCPNLGVDPNVVDSAGTLYVALAGAGAWQLPGGDVERAVRIKARSIASGDALQVCESVESAHSKHADAARIVAHVPFVAGEPVRMDSQCKYALVARGDAHAYLRLPTRADYREKIWDHAAGLIVAREADAVVTDVHGKALDFRHGRTLEQNRGVICASRGAHQPLVDACQQLGIG